MNVPPPPFAALPYLRLKLARALFRKPPRALPVPEAARLEKIVARQARIEAAILATPEAANVVVPAATQTLRLVEIRRRYPNRREFLADMRENALDEATLQAALTRDLVIDAVLEQVAASTPPISELDAEIYYHRHPGAFSRPETRRLRHILVTFDDAAQKAAASALLAALRARIQNIADFAAAAARHSQCPTALEEGVIGTVKPGQLYPELEPVAFALRAGEISLPLESPIGLHLLLCEAIHPALSL